MIHVLIATDQKKEFRMGRGHESEVRVNDISVSRLHAIIKFKENGFYVQDNNSKFGTLSLVRGKLPMELDKAFAVQIGRTVVSFTVKDIFKEKERKE